MSSNELNFLIEFKNKYLHGNIDELADFSFWDINTNAGEYFSGNKRVQSEEDFDGDRTKIVYTIQYLLLDGSGIPNFSRDAPRWGISTLHTSAPDFLEITKSPARS